MADKLPEMLKKVELVLDRLQAAREENAGLKRENRELKTQLQEIRKLYESVRLQAGDRDDAIRSKLVGILDRLDRLEQMAG